MVKRYDGSKRIVQRIGTLDASSFYYWHHWQALSPLGGGPFERVNAVVPIPMRQLNANGRSRINAEASTA